MRVLMMTRSFPPNYSGAAKQAITLSKGLRSLGHEIIFVTDNGSSATQVEEFEGFKTFRVRTLSGKKFLIQPRYFLFGIKTFLHAVSNNVDIVFMHAIGGLDLISFPLLKLFGKKTIVELTLVDEDDPLTLKRRKAGFLFSFLLSFADVIVPISTRLKELSIEAGVPEKRLLQIPVGVNTELFRFQTIDLKEKMRIKLDIPLDSKVYFAAGKVESRKNYDLMIRAWRLIQDRFKDARLYIAGPLSEEEKDFVTALKNEINSNNLNVTFLGLINNVSEYMMAADCQLHCATAEGLPNVLVEASLTGLYIVCRQMPGITSDIILSCDIGTECKSDKPEEFANLAIEALIRKMNPEKRLNEYNVLLERFSIESVAKKYSEYFKEIAHG